jgi:hypothetical protein
MNIDEKSTNAAAAKRTPSGILREQHPRERMLLCAEERPCR